MSEQNSAAASASNSTLVRGVDLTQVNLTVLTAALKEAGVKVTAKHNTAARVELLMDFEIAACPNDAALAEEDRKGGGCDVCGGFSQLSRPACPYCGTSETQPAATSPVAQPAPKSAKAAKEKAATKKKEKADKVKKPKVEPEKVALAKAEASGKILKANTAKILDHEKRIRGLLADSFNGIWKLGREINIVYQAGAFKFHVDDNGKPLFTFSTWCESVNISPQYARSLMAVAVNFNEKQIRDVGVTKLNIVLRLPEQARGEILEKASGMSRDELEAEVRQVAPGAGREHVASGNEATARPGLAASNNARAKARPSRVVAANEVTVAIALARTVIPLFSRAKSAETEEPMRAKTVASDPHAVHDLQNGVRAYYKVIEDEEGLSIVVEYKRVAEEAAAE